MTSTHSPATSTLTPAARAYWSGEKILLSHVSCQKWVLEMCKTYSSTFAPSPRRGLASCLAERLHALE